jgi:hypothetical protein
LLNQAAEARLPGLTRRDVMGVQEGREASNFKPHQQRGRIPPRIRDEDLELVACASVGDTVLGKT